MLSYGGLSRSRSNFRSFTGLELSEFDSVYAEVEGKYGSFEERRLSREGRKRAVGAGRPFKLSLRDRLLIDASGLLPALRHVGYLFDLDQSNMLKNIRVMEPVVKECIPLPKNAGARRARTINEVEEYFPGFKAFIDATEQEIPRPKDRRKRKSHHSGKKRRHTVKTQITVNRNGLIDHSQDEPC